MHGRSNGPRKGRPKIKFKSDEEELKYLQMEIEFFKYFTILLTKKISKKLFIKKCFIGHYKVPTIKVSTLYVL